MPDVDTISEKIENAILTTAADEKLLATPKREREGYDEEWQDLVDYKLVEWGRNPDQLRDENVVVPSRAAISKACKLAVELRKEGSPPPTRVVPSGEGGIVFEHRTQTIVEVLEIDIDASIEYLVFSNCRLVHRRQISGN